MRCLLVMIVLVSAVAYEILCDDNTSSKNQKDEIEAAHEPKHEQTPERQAETERGAQLASLVANKIKRLTKVIFKHVNTDFDKKSLMDQLETIITDIGRKNHFTTEEIKVCTKLILEGIEFALKHKKHDKTIDRRSNNDDNFSPIFKIASVVSDTTTTVTVTSTTRAPISKYTETQRINTTQIWNNKAMTKSNPRSSKNPTPCLINAICAKIRNLGKFQCSDGSNVDINQLCDGKVHCADGSDERQCMQLASSKAQKVKRIFNSLRNSIFRNCFISKKKSLLAILKTLEARLKNFRRGGSVVIANQLAAVYQIAVGLGESFCMQPKSIKCNLIERNENTKDTREPWSAKLCSCENGSCREASCHHSCRTFCDHRQQLARWDCPAGDGNKSVSFDRICDGLPDCSDGTDEINCSNDKFFDKFKVRKIQDELIGKIKSKINHALYLAVTSKLQNLIRLIKELQPMTSFDNAKEKVVSRRNKVIDALVFAYTELGDEMTSEKMEDEVYRFLKSLSVGVVEVTKRQLVIEQRAVACPCNGAECVLKNCTRTCARKCAAKARLRTFDCAGVQLPPSAICNGTPECPDGSDERNCKTGFCQKYHLIELMRNADKVVKKLKGTSIGEILDSWLTKFQKNIRSQLNSGMEKRRLLLMLVTEGLDDLVSTYAAMDARRSSDALLLEAMEAASKELKNTLKLCSK